MAQQDHSYDSLEINEDRESMPQPWLVKQIQSAVKVIAARDS